MKRILLATACMFAFACGAQESKVSTYDQVQAIKAHCQAAHPDPTDASSPTFFDDGLAAQKAYSQCVFDAKMALLPQVPAVCLDTKAKLSADASRACLAALNARNDALSLINSAEPTELDQAIDTLQRAINSVPYTPGYVPEYSGRRP